MSSNSDEPLSKELVSVSLTPDVMDFVRKCVKLELLDKLPSEDSFDLDQLINLTQKYNANQDDLNNLEKVNLNKLMRNSYIVDRKKVLTDAAKKLSDIELMRRRSKEREYQGLLGNFNTESPRENLSDFKRSLALGTNLLLGIFLTFLAGYWGLLYLGIKETTPRAIVGMIFSIICLLTEVTLFLIRDNRDEKSKSKQSSQYAPYTLNHKSEGAGQSLNLRQGDLIKESLDGSKTNLNESESRQKSHNSFDNQQKSFEPSKAKSRDRVDDSKSPILQTSNQRNMGITSEEYPLSTFTSARENMSKNISKRNKKDTNQFSKENDN